MIGGYTNCRALVLGASGFIGGWTARLLTAAGATVGLAARERAALRTNTVFHGLGGEILEGDLTGDGLEAVLADFRPSIVFNLAGYGVDQSERDLERMRALNTDLPRRLTEALGKREDRNWTGIRLVHAGSAAEYGSTGGDLSENSVPKPLSRYGETKLAGTNWVIQSSQRGTGAAVARLFTVYGPLEHPTRLLPALLRAQAEPGGIELTGGEQRRDFTYVGDAAEGLLRLGLAGTGKQPVVNVATGTLMSVREFVLTAAAELGIAENRLRFGKLAGRADEMIHDPVNIGRMRQLLGWTPSTRANQGVRQTAALLNQALTDPEGSQLTT